MKMTTVSNVVCLLLAVLVTGCIPTSKGTPAPEQALAVEKTTLPSTLTVFAAASLVEPFEAIGQAFEAQPENAGVAVEFSFAGSQQLARQINEGAPADVFASANQAQMDAVTAAGNADAAGSRVFAENRLVVIVPEGNPAQLQDLSGLAAPGVKLVLAAREVPAGQYSLEFLGKASADPQFGADYESKVLANVVSYEENVRSVRTKVELGEADAGIVYATDAVDAGVTVIEIPAELNVIARYPIVALSASSNREVAQRFVDFVLSPEGQRFLVDYGFGQSNQ